MSARIPSARSRTQQSSLLAGLPKGQVSRRDDSKQVQYLVLSVQHKKWTPIPKQAERECLSEVGASVT